MRKQGAPATTRVAGRSVQSDSLCPGVFTMLTHNLDSIAGVKVMPLRNAARRPAARSAIHHTAVSSSISERRRSGMLSAARPGISGAVRLFVFRFFRYQLRERSAQARAEARSATTSATTDNSEQKWRDKSRSTRRLRHPTGSRVGTSNTHLGRRRRAEFYTRSTTSNMTCSGESRESRGPSEH